MKRFSIILLSLMLTNLSFAKKVKDPVVATVNGKSITTSNLLEYHEQNLKYVRGNKKVTLNSSLDDLINRIVGIDRAKSNKLHKNPIVIKKMNDILYHAQISKDLEGQLQKIKVSDKEVSRFYQKNPEYNTSQILYRLPATPNKKDVADGFKQQTNLYNEVIKKPDSFADVASRFSQAAGAMIGGSLGWQPKTRLTPEFYSKIKGKKAGYITKPFRTQYGWHIVKVLAVKKEKDINKKMYKKIIYDIKRDKILADYFSKMRRKAKVSVNKNNFNKLK